MHKRTARILFILSFFVYFAAAYPVTAYFSDCQSFLPIQQEAVCEIEKFHPATLFIGGDITLHGSRQDEFNDFFNVMKPLADSTYELSIQQLMNF